MGHEEDVSLTGILTKTFSISAAEKNFLRGFRKYWGEKHLENACETSVFLSNEFTNRLHEWKQHERL